MTTNCKVKTASETVSDNIEDLTELDAVLPVAKKAKIIDVERIIMGEEFPDVEINFAKQLLKNQFPKVTGLTCILYQEKKVEFGLPEMAKLLPVACKRLRKWNFQKFINMVSDPLSITR